MPEEPRSAIQPHQRERDRDHCERQGREQSDHRQIERPFEVTGIDTASPCRETTGCVHPTEAALNLLHCRFSVSG